MTHAIIFDLGNVLVDYDHGASMQALADRSAVDSEHMAAFFRTLAHEAGTGELGARAVYNALVTATELSATYGEFIDLFATGITRNEKALAYAVELQRRPDVTVAVISNTNAAHVAWLDVHVPELAEFDLVIMSNEVALLKPDSTIFRLALELLNLDAGEAVFVDDIGLNVDAARALGIAGIVHQSWIETKLSLESWLGAQHL